jgi:hypothetical protein
VKTRIKEVANLTAISIDGDAHKQHVSRDAVGTPAYNKTCESELHLAKTPSRNNSNHRSDACSC